MTVITPSSKQQLFLASTAGITIYGGSAYGGKTFGLLLEPLYHREIKGFNGVCFRRTMPQIKNAGGLWDESYNLYPSMGGKANKNDFTWTFGNQGSAYIKFDSLQYDNTVYDFQGAQIALELFDELTHFTSKQFWYMVSRNRSTCGIRPYIKATTNPDASSWVKTLLAPWVDSKFDGVPAGGGELRYFIRRNDSIVWVDKQYKDDTDNGVKPTSITFIPANIFDNEIGMKKDPTYLSKLHQLDYIEKRRLLYGDWDILPEAGKVFNRNKIQAMYPPTNSGTSNNIVRFWDFAATERQAKKPVPDYTVGIKMIRIGQVFYILDIIRVQLSSADVDSLVYDTAILDGPNVAIRWEMEGGSGGKMVSHYLTSRLMGFDAQGIRPRGDKIQRARPLAAQVESGNVYIAPHIPNSEEYLTELHHFPNWSFDDTVDATSGAFTYLIAESNTWNDTDLQKLAL